VKKLREEVKKGEDGSRFEVSGSMFLQNSFFDLPFRTANASSSNLERSI